MIVCVGNSGKAYLDDGNGSVIFKLEQVIY